MIVFNNSIIGRMLRIFGRFKAIMLFGMVFVGNYSLSEKDLCHERVHCQQYADCFWIGGTLGILIMFLLFILGIQSIYMLFLILVPILFFYIIYIMEWLIRLIITKDRMKAYDDISFERQARWISDTWNLPCKSQNKYSSFGWIRFLKE